MTRSSPENRLTLKWLYVQKYVVIFFMFVAALGWWRAYSGQEFDRKAVASEAFTAVSTAFLLALIYDVFLHRTEKKSAAEERAELVEAVGTNFLEFTDLNLLTQDHLASLAQKISKCPAAIEAVSEVVVGRSNYKALNRHLCDIRENRIFREVEIKNILRESDRADCYEVEFIKQFEVHGDKRELLIVVSSDNELFNKLVTSPIQVDVLAGISESQWHVEPIIKDLRLTAKVRGVKAEAVELMPKVLDGDALGSRWQIARAPLDAKGYLFALPDNQQAYHFQLAFKTYNEIVDPYYYWVAENPMYVKSILIDYGRVKRRLGHVSKNCFIGNVCSPEYDEENGLFEIKVDDILWPGQGAMIAWRPEKAALPAVPSTPSEAAA